MAYLVFSIGSDPIVYPTVVQEPRDGSGRELCVGTGGMQQRPSLLPVRK
jgi:hypothetical protein